MARPKQTPLDRIASATLAKLAEIDKMFSALGPEHADSVRDIRLTAVKVGLTEYAAVQVAVALDKVSDRLEALDAAKVSP